MFDLRALRDDPQAFIDGWNRRESGMGDAKVSEILALDEDLRAAVTQKQEAEADRNAKSKQIGKAKASGDDVLFNKLREEVAAAKQTIEAAGAREDEVRGKLDAILMSTPNLPMPDVPLGAGEEDNVEVKRTGTPRRFNYAPQDHVDIGAALGGMDFETAAKMSGARFVLLSGQLARLERALAAFMLDVQTQEHGYTEVSPPLLVRDTALEGTGQLPKFGEDLFTVESPRTRGLREYVTSESNSVSRHEGMLHEMRNNSSYTEEFRSQLIQTIEESIREVNNFNAFANEIAHSLIPTAEVPLTNIVRETIIDHDYLPRRYAAHTPCFRSEAGSAGRDTRGMIRLHQFNKVEMVSVVKDEAEGLVELERMTECAEAILERLDLPYRRMTLCTGDMGFGARKTYDLEVWLPAQDTYREISSCSYCGDFQARRMDARWRPMASEDNPKPKPQYVHTLNGSGLAVGRTLVAVLENYQNEDGSVTVPEALRNYMGGLEVISA